MTTPTCPICYNESIPTTTPYWECVRCSVWFQSPAPAKHYRADDEDIHAPPTQEDIQANAQLANSLFYNVLKGVPGRTLEIGAMHGLLSMVLREFGCQAEAMEPITDREDIIQDDFEQTTQTYGPYQLIMLVHVFEHLYDPVAVLKKLRQWVADDGYVYLRMPDRKVPGYQRDLTPHHYQIHPFYHTLSSVQAAISGFVIEQTFPFEPGQRDYLLRPVQNKIAIIRPGAIGDCLMLLNFMPQFHEYEVHFYTGYVEPLSDFMHRAGVAKVFHQDQFPQDTYVKVFTPVGYPLQEGYPTVPMQHHLLEYFRREFGLPRITQLTVPCPPRPEDAPEEPYATLQTRAGWSHYKEWDQWDQLLDDLPFPIVHIDEYYGRTLDHSIALVANATLHLGIDSFANHLTHYLWQDASGEVRQVPGVILFGSTQPSASGYATNTNLSAGFPCQPCFKENPKISKQSNGPCIFHTAYGETAPCMALLEPKTVAEAIRMAWEKASIQTTTTIK